MFPFSCIPEDSLYTKAKLGECDSLSDKSTEDPHGILLQYSIKGICQTDYHINLVWFLSKDLLFYGIKWNNCHLQLCTIFLYNCRTTIQTCVNYYSLITFLSHHTIYMMSLHSRPLLCHKQFFVTS